MEIIHSLTKICCMWETVKTYSKMKDTSIYHSCIVLVHYCVYFGEATRTQIVLRVFTVVTLVTLWPIKYRVKIFFFFKIRSFLNAADTQSNNHSILGIRLGRVVSVGDLKLDVPGSISSRGGHGRGWQGTFTSLVLFSLQINR